MSNNNLQIELQEAQQKKIEFFCQFINNNNISQAEYYLNKANWDENLAVQYFYNRPDYANNYKQNISKKNSIQNEKVLKMHASAKMNDKNNNDIIDKNYVRYMYNPKNKYLEFNIENIIVYEKNKGIHHTYDKTLLYIKNNLKNVELNFKTFINILENNVGIILVFNDESCNKIKEQIKQINELNEKIQDYIIFPASSNSNEGINIIIGLSCISFPSYIFCKYKDEKNILITDKMEGAFDKTFLLDSINKVKPLLKRKENVNNKNLNMKMQPKNEKNVMKNENEIKKINLFQEFINNDHVSKKNNLPDKNKSKKDNTIPVPKYNNNNSANKEIENNEMDSYHKENKNIQNKNNNENNFNKNKKEEEFKNKINNNSKIDKNKKSEINYSNYEDFFLGDSIEIPYLFGFYNNNSKSNFNMNNDKEKLSNNNINKENENNNKHIFNNNNNNLDNLKESNIMLRDSIYNLSDGQVLAKREQEMRRLEKMQEEKEQKEKEEKRKQKEEERKIKKYEKEAEIVKMILPPEPDDNNPDACHIKFRLPDGEKILERKFLKTDKIAVLYDYIKSIGREIFIEPDANDFNIICIGFPPKNLENLKNSTLEKEGLYPNSILQIEEK